MTTDQIATGLITFILGGGLMLTIQRGVKAYRAVRSGALSDSGSVLDRLEAENVRLTGTINELRTRLDVAEQRVDAAEERESKMRRGKDTRIARLEVQLIRLGEEPEGGIGGD